MKKQLVLRSLTAATALAVMALSAPAANAGFSGTAAVLSKYVLRGSTMDPENDSATVQAGVNYNTDFGLYAGWWGSSLDYNNSTDPAASKGFENDFILGYSMEAAGMTFDFGLVKYYYIGVDESDAFEPYFNLTWGPVTFGVKYLATDVIWGNTGDMYFTLGYKQKLPEDFTFSGVLGYYKYDDSGDWEAPSVYLTNGLATTESSGFKHLDLTISHPLGKTGLDMSITYIVGGEDRSGVDIENTMVLGVSGAF